MYYLFLKYNSSPKFEIDLFIILGVHDYLFRGARAVILIKKAFISIIKENKNTIKLILLNKI